MRIGYRKNLSEEFLRSVGILFLRLFLGIRLIYGVVDNILSREKMIEFSHFLAAHEFPFPVISAVVSVYVQFFGSISLLVGYKLRLFSFLLIVNFAIALVFVHIANSDSFEGMTPALAMFFGSLTLLFTGAEKISLDYFFRKKN